MWNNGDMNVLTLLLPKAEVDHIESGDTVRQAISKLNYHHYGALPVLSKQGHYLYSVSTSDLLYFMAERDLSLQEAENVAVDEVPIFRPNPSLPVTASLRDIHLKLLDQNYCPLVDDKGIFVGIITRKGFVSKAMRLVEE